MSVQGRGVLWELEEGFLLAGMAWQALWGRRVGARSWRMGEDCQGPRNEGRGHGVSREPEAPASVSASELGATYKGKASSRI